MGLIRTIALAAGLFGAIVGAQLPELRQQYLQRLGGAIDEVAAIVARFEADALSNQLRRDEALSKLAASTDDLVRRRGQDMIMSIERLRLLEENRQELDRSDPIGRLVYFLGHADGGLMTATISDFRPAVPTTNEGLLCAGLGFIAGRSI